MTRHLPMFPLRRPLLPGVGLPLQVFEPRYLAMMDDVLEGAGGGFGVVLIVRGSEVGGGDLRADVGTRAEVVSHDTRRDGRRLVLAVGADRIRVRRWLRDDPYPSAEVEPWPDEAAPTDEPDAPGPVPSNVAELQDQMDRLVAVVTDHVGADEHDQLVEATRLPDDLDTAIWQAAVVADLGPFDLQRLLEAPGQAQRLPLLGRLLQERRDVLAFSLGETGA